MERKGLIKMQVSVIWELKDLFGLDFEKYIADRLESLGFKCFVSVYSKHLDVESQIDIVALCRYSIVCIECKSWNSLYVDWDKNELDWKYKTINGNTKAIRNPLRQCANQTETLRRELADNIENEIRYRFKSTPYPCYSAVVLKGNGSETKSRKLGTSSNNIYMCNDLELLRDRYLLEPNVEIDKDVIEAYSQFFINRADTSEVKLLEHKRYIENCKRTNSGLWRPHTGLELYQM